MHSWGDGFKYFREVGQAADEIGNFCRRWGRINVTCTKEKYGTARVYCMFGCNDLHGLIYPGYVYVQRPQWLAKLIGQKALYSVMTFPFFRPFVHLIVRYQHFLYRLAYKKALKKYPMIREEILDGADYSEHLEGL